MICTLEKYTNNIFYANKATKIKPAPTPFGRLLPISSPATKILPRKKSNNLAYYSPEVKLRRRQILDRDDIINQFCQLEDDVPKIFFPSSVKMPSNEHFPGARMHMMNSFKSLKGYNNLAHIVTQKNAKTPMQSVWNPLCAKAHNLGENANSDRDQFSDLSDEDLEFLDEYLNTIPVTYGETPNHKIVDRYR